MTVIVGLEFNGKVLIAGDIQGTGGNNKVIHTQPKVFNKNGIIFGYTTSYRFGQIIEHGLQNPIVPDNLSEIYKWLITVLIPSIKSSLSTANYEEGGNCLIGVRGQLWQLQSDFSVLRSVKGYDAIGAGSEYALGSVFTQLSLLHPKSLENAKALLSHAVEVAGIFCPSVGTSSTVIST
jgi:ATP-dependent protease HslVU (ClpYQ) peptidase subunit